MAWNTITDVNDGQSWGGSNFQEVQDAITQIQTSLGASEGLAPVRIATVTNPTGATTLATGISSSFRWLEVRFNGRHDNASTSSAYREIQLQFNSDNSSSYQASHSTVDEAGSETHNAASSSLIYALAGHVGTVAGTMRCLISNYATRKTVEGVSVATTSAFWVTDVQRTKFASSWISNSLISSIGVRAPAGGDDWATGTDFQVIGHP